VRLWLVYINHIVGMLAARAAERHSPYALLFEILVELAESQVDMAKLRHRASEEARDDTPEAMDRLWEEEAVRFGSSAPDANGASSCRPAFAASARAQGQP
jgi:nitrate reductase delta subunit